MTTAVISDQAKSILNAVKQLEKATVASIASYLGIAAPKVTGSMASLKKNGLLTISEGVVLLTEEGITQLDAPTAEQRVEAATTASLVQPSVATAASTSEDGTPIAPKAAVTRGASPRIDSKASKAQIIFDEMKNGKRADLMARLMGEVGLSQHGANTYLHNMRKKAGMVVPRGTAAPVATQTSSELTSEVTDETVQLDVTDEEVVEPPETTNAELQPTDEVQETPEASQNDESAE